LSSPKKSLNFLNIFYFFVLSCFFYFFLIFSLFLFLKQGFLARVPERQNAKTPRCQDARVPECQDDLPPPGFTWRFYLRILPRIFFLRFLCRVPKTLIVSKQKVLSFRDYFFFLLARGFLRLLFSPVRAGSWDCLFLARARVVF